MKKIPVRSEDFKIDTNNIYSSAWYR